MLMTIRALISIMSQSFNSFLQFQCYIPHMMIFIITSLTHRMMFKIKKLRVLGAWRCAWTVWKSCKIFPVAIILISYSTLTLNIRMGLIIFYTPHAQKHISNFTNIQEKLQYVWRFINSRAVLSLQNLYKWVCVTNFSETLLSF